MKMSKLETMEASEGKHVRIIDTEGETYEGFNALFESAEDNDDNDTGDAEASVTLTVGHNKNINFLFFEERDIVSIEIIDKKPDK